MHNPNKQSLKHSQKEARKNSLASPKYKSFSTESGKQRNAIAGSELFTVRVRTIHQTGVYQSSEVVTRPPRFDKSEGELFVTHLSAYLKNLNKDFVEVQAGIRHNDQNIFVAVNKKQIDLKKIVSEINNAGLKEHIKQHITSTLLSKSYSNVRKTENDINRRIYELYHFDLKKTEAYKIIYAEGRNGYHAETKLPNNMDIIGGTMRPCQACNAILHKNQNNKSAISNPGYDFDTKNAVAPLTEQNLKLHNTLTHVNQGSRGYNPAITLSATSEIAPYAYTVNNYEKLNLKNSRKQPAISPKKINPPVRQISNIAQSITKTVPDIKSMPFKIRKKR